MTIHASGATARHSFLCRLPRCLVVMASTLDRERPLRDRCGVAETVTETCVPASTHEGAQSVEGDQLRAARHRTGISLDTLARRGGLSKSHLSLVERGLRPVTMSTLAGYTRAAVTVEATPNPEDDEMQRRRFLASIMAAAVGMPLDEPLARLLDAVRLAPAPNRVDLPEVLQIEQTHAMYTEWDLRWGGGLAAEMACVQLRWATSLLDKPIAPPVRERLFSAIGNLASRAATASFDVGQPQVGRKLGTLAVHMAGEAGDADLRAHVLSDLALQATLAGHPDDGLALVRVAEASDGRLAPATVCVLRGTAARSCAARGEDPTRYIREAEDAYTRVESVPRSMRGFFGLGHLQGVTGHARFAAAQHAEAHSRLSRALEAYDPARARAVVHCASRLSALHFAAGEPDVAVGVGRKAQHAACGMRSVHVAGELRMLHEAAEPYQSRDDVADLRHALTRREPPPDEGCERPLRSG